MGFSLLKEGGGHRGWGFQGLEYQGLPEGEEEGKTVGDLKCGAEALEVQSSESGGLRREG